MNESVEIFEEICDEYIGKEVISIFKDVVVEKKVCRMMNNDNEYNFKYRFQ